MMENENIPKMILDLFESERSLGNFSENSMKVLESIKDYIKHRKKKLK